MPLYPPINISPSNDPDQFGKVVADLVKRDRAEFRTGDGRHSPTRQGVDICFESEDKDTVFCVLSEDGDDISFETVEDKLDDLEEFDRDVDEFIVATTAPNDERLQRNVEQLSEEREAAGKARIRLLMRDDLEGLLTEHDEVLREYYPQLHRDLVTVRAAGFVRVTEEYLERQSTPSPAVCWRTGFTLAAVSDGYAFDRWHDDTGTLVGDELVDRLRNGDSTVVLGPPGSGKSTICKSVACEWHERDHGTVFYRTSEARNHFGPEDAGTLEDRIDLADGHVLVVVEDAMSPDAAGLSELIRRFRDSTDVTFLLDCRTQNWRDTDDPVLGSRSSQANQYGLREYHVPRITAEECSEFVGHFEDALGVDLALSGDQLFGGLSSEPVTFAEVGGQFSGNGMSPLSQWFDSAGAPSSRVGELLLLASRLEVESDEERIAEDDPSEALKTSVSSTYHEIADDAEDEGLTLKVSLLAATLNAAGIGVYPELVHALGRGSADHRRVGEALDRLEGTLVVGDGSERYRAPHGQWAELFLEYALDRLGDRAVALFEDCVNDLFSLVDSSERRTDIEDWFGRELLRLDAIDADPETAGDVFVERIFDVGRRRPTLAPLFGTSDQSEIDVPDACSPGTTADCANWRGQSSLDRGKFDRAVAEFERLETHAETIDDREQADEIRAWMFNNLGVVAQSRGDLDAAEDYYLRSVSLLYDLGDECYQATTVSNLGNVVQERGDLDAAETYYQRSLDFSSNLGDERGRARSLNDLGTVAQARGDYDDAADYYQQSLSILDDLGDEHGEATSLNNLGNVARARGDYATAADYYQRSYAILLDFVDGRGQAQSLGNLGVVARSRGDLDAATDYYQRSLNLMGDLGDEHGEATSLNNLGNVARSRGDLDAAEEYYRRSLEIKRDLGDEHGEATSLNNLGNVARSRGDLDAAEEYYRRSLEIKRDLGDEHGEATSLNNLGLVAREEDDYRTARECFENAVEVFLDVGTIEETLTVLDNAIDACQRVGDSEAVVDHCETALELAEGTDAQERLREFQRTYANLSARDPEESTLELHRLAFTHVLETEPMAAIVRFAETWGRRSELDADSEAYATTLDAGVCLAGHVRLLDSDDPADELPDPDAILDSVADETDRLSASIEPLFERLARGETDTAPNDLYKMANEADDELARMQARVAGILLENLD